MPRVGTMVTTALYSHSPSKFGFVQDLTGLQMWRCGASSKVR